MNWEATWDFAVIIILIINFIIAAVTTIIGLFLKKGTRCIVVALGILSFFCPLVLLLFLGIGQLSDLIMGSTEVDMRDVSFDKTREKLSVKPDDDAEMNYVPIEDAIRLSDLPDLRRLLMDILKYNSGSSIGSIAGAMNSEDTEASHYAASAIQDALNEFRNTSLKLNEQLQRYPDDVEINIAALEYVHTGITLKIMTDTEQRSYTYTEDAIAENLYNRNMWFMTAEHYGWMVSTLVDIGDYAAAEKWAERCAVCRPDALDTYKSRLRLLYAQGKRQEFFACIEKFKQTDIEADQEMLDVIRLYQ